MRGLTVFLILMLLTFKATSQTATSKDSTICIPVKHVRLMVLDIEKGDKCAQELELVKENLTHCTSKNHLSDSLLTIADKKEQLFKTNILNYEKIVINKDTQIQGLNAEIKKIKRSKNIIFISSIVVITALIFLK